MDTAFPAMGMRGEGVQRRRREAYYINVPLGVSSESTTQPATLPRLTVNETADSLSRQTLASLRGFFQTKTSHRPSPDMWAALEDLALVLERMSNGTCPPGVYLSSLDPGVGKTQTITHFVKALMGSSAHQGVGVVVYVSRLAEIESMVSSMNLAASEYAVFTSDKDLNRLGCDSPGSGRILFTTQQMLESRCLETGSFERTEEFHYQGRPRMVRIWDETMLPGETITLSRDELGLLFKPLRGYFPALVETLETVFMDLRTAGDGSTFTIPDFAEAHHVGVNDALRAFDGGGTSEQTAVSTVWLLSGKTVTIRRDGQYGNTLLDYRETLPADLGPVVVLDASGRVRTTYREWERYRGGLHRLKSAEKSYRNLTINVWGRGGGKSAFKGHGRELVEGIAETIRKRPEEEWLVVHHKSTASFDVEALVRDLTSDEVAPDRLHFLSWGNHHATNDFSHVPNVILAGTLFYRASRYEALGRLSASKRAEEGVYSAERRKGIELGEHAHLVLQALCRGAVRVCEGGECAPCEAYVIASPRSGIKEALPTIFPGARVRPWKPTSTALKGKVKEAVEFIDGWFADYPGQTFLRFRDVMKSIGMMDSRNFRKVIRQHADFVQALSERSIIEDGTGRYHTGFRRLTAEYFGFTEEE